MVRGGQCGAAAHALRRGAWARLLALPGPAGLSLLAQEPEPVQLGGQVKVDIPALLGQRRLVERLEPRAVLGNHELDPAKRPLLGIGQVARHLDDGPLTGSRPAAQLAIADVADQGPQHDRCGTQGLQDLLSPVNHLGLPYLIPSGKAWPPAGLPRLYRAPIAVTLVAPC
jgi:hypothetical protein